VGEDAQNKILIIGETMYPHNKNLSQFARDLRKNMTKEERHLWYDFLKKFPIVVKKQYVIDSYILDFFIPSKKIAIEIDGSQHYEPGARAADLLRDTELMRYGIKVLRYTNFDIQKRFEGVASDILNNTGLEITDLKLDIEVIS
jgi:very-short-patch-repair endonuclease